ncbi:hypothetical protein [Aquimarina sp. AU58]|uniref:hypothetical protein n=1 Tax=Aquimarina sp. AU58 TaxID=1874112 RepID=UPI00135C0EBF|nr:hypothetical protein [Aquimarina sp. AU58]
MRDLKLEEVQEVNGGEFNLGEFVDGACSVVSIAGWFVPGMQGAAAACTVYKVGKVIVE